MTVGHPPTVLVNDCWAPANCARNHDRLVFVPRSRRTAAEANSTALWCAEAARAKREAGA
eukprot:scaffold44025_cov58-Phaeocystis_antarctica.AAC.2